jgi:hypothetical protein
MLPNINRLRNSERYPIGRMKTSSAHFECDSVIIIKKKNELKYIEEAGKSHVKNVVDCRPILH